MKVEDVFVVKGRGPVATMRLSGREPKVGDRATVNGAGPFLVIGVERHRAMRPLHQGEGLGLLLRGVAELAIGDEIELVGARHMEAVR